MRGRQHPHQVKSLPPKKNNLKGKVVLVTGATRGIGKGIAIAFGELGATVYITGRSRSKADSQSEVGGSLEETKILVEEAGGICLSQQIDHADPTQIEHLFKTIEQEQNGTLDVLINNVFSGVKSIKNNSGIPFWEADSDVWDSCHNVGLKSHYLASRLAAKMMVPKKSGLICTISSWGGLAPIFGVSYGAGKSACDRMASDMAIELTPHQVTSLSVWPGIVGTEEIKAISTEAEAEDNAMTTVFKSKYNWESPLFVGRAIAALACEKDHLKRSGKVQIIAELAKEFKTVDENGFRPVSLRSFRFLIASSLPQLQAYDQFISDIKIPWLLLLWKFLSSPKL